VQIERKTKLFLKISEPMEQRAQSDARISPAES